MVNLFYKIVIVILSFALAVALIYIWVYSPAPKDKPIEHQITVNKELPVFMLASYQITYTGRIYKDGTDYLFSFPIGGYNVSIDYTAEILIGTDIYPAVTRKDDNKVRLDFKDLHLKVIAVTPTSLKLNDASVSGWRWIRGGGIPIDEGLFSPFMAVLQGVEKFENDPEVMKKAQESLIRHYKSFYNSINYDVEIINLSE